MPSMSSGFIIRRLLENNGVYPGDPQVLQVVSYRHAVSNALVFHVAYQVGELRELYMSPYVMEITVLWTRADGLTNAGRKFMEATK